MTFAVYTATAPVVLASGSPRRRDFLRDLGIPFTIDAVPQAEPFPQPGELPEAFARRAARAKTTAVAGNHPGVCVIGADTIVVLGTEIMGKPEDDTHALDMLTRLSGVTHEVITGVCVVLPDGQDVSFAASTAVTMAAHPVAALLAYIRTGEPVDKAGAYAIQGIGSFLVECIEGSWSNVVGLPLTQLLDVLVTQGVVVPSIADQR